MSKSKLLLPLLLFTFLLFGCSNTAEESNVNFSILATEKTLPLNFEEIAYQSKISFSQYLVRKSSDPSQFEDNWRLYGLSQPIADVDFTKHDVFFFGLIESGSCPDEINKLNFHSENNSLTIPVSGTGGACTADATPRTIVIQIEKELSDQINEIIMLKYDKETNIPIELTK